MSTKKIGLAILSVAAIAGVVSCSGTTEASSSAANGKKTVNLTVWAPTEESDTMTSIIADFKAAEATAHPDITYNINHVALAEGDTKAELLKSPDDAADVFATTDDSCQVLAEAGNVYEIPQGSAYYTNATTKNAASTVEGVTYNGKIYGFPETADNGYFLMYNSNVITDDEAKSFDKIMAKAEAQSKKVFYNYKNSWYTLAFMNINGNRVGHNAEGDYCNWSENGLAGFKAMYTYGAKKSVLIPDSDNNNTQNGLKDGSVCAAITGTWNYDAVKDVDGLKCTKLPTLRVDGTDTQMTSFAGGKVVCVNAVTKNPTEAMRFADFMTNEASQTLRFNNRGIGPSNINAAATDAVKANPALKALADQSVYAISQSGTMSSTLNSHYWSAAEALGAHIEAQDLDTDEAMAAAIKTCENSILGR